VQPSLDFDPASTESRLANVYSLPHRQRDKDRVLTALTEAGEEGLTDFELSYRLSVFGPAIGQTSAGKRRLDLERDGLVARRLVIDPHTYALIPDRRPSPTGALAGVYVLAKFSRPDVL
jgi:hypothetical protein